MIRTVIVVPAVLAVLALPACRPLPERTAPTGAPAVVAGYVASWKSGDGGERIQEIAADHLTHVIYAFGAIAPDGRAVLGDACLDTGHCSTAADSARAGVGGNFAQLQRLEQRHPHLRTLISIGGWTGSGRFSDIARTDSSRRRFVDSVLELYIRSVPGLFDGVDVDWEYPVEGGLPTNAARPEDRYNFTLLIEEFRRQLDAQGLRDGRRYLLTAATSAGPRAGTDLELVRLTALLDWFNVMAYDYHAASGITHFNAPLFAATDDPTPFLTVDATLRRYLEGGVPRDKVVLGMPFYGRVYAGVDSTHGGLFREATASPPARWGTAVDARTLRSRAPEANGFRKHWHIEARVPWLYNQAEGVWITYEDATSIREKAAYAGRHRLRGTMAWDVLGDDGTLTAAMATGLRDGLR